MPTFPKDLNAPVQQAIFGCFKSRVFCFVLFFSKEAKKLMLCSS